MSAPASARKLFLMGGNIGLGFETDKCYFSVEENGVRNDWTTAETLARIDDFSEAARTRILACCAHPVPAVLYQVINDQGATLLFDVTHTEACSAIDAHQGAPEWQGNMRIRRQR